MRKENVVDEIRFLATELVEHSFENHIAEFTEHEQIHCMKNGAPLILTDGTLAKTKDRDLGVTTKEGMRAYIEDFLKNPKTKALAVKNDFSRLAFYNKADNMLAIIDKNGENFGTIFRPDKGENGKFKNLMIEAKNNRKNAPILDGGYIGIRQAHSKKHIFKFAETYTALQRFLNKNGRTPMPTPKENNTQNDEQLIPRNIMNDEQSIAFITEEKNPATVFFNSTHKTLIVASQSTQRIQPFEDENDGFEEFERLYQQEQSKFDEEVKVLSGSFSDIAKQFQEKTGNSLGVGQTNRSNEPASNEPLDLDIPSEG